MATLRELKGRIGSVASSEKITGAMKMISSAKMRKEELALRKLTPFRSQIEAVIANLLSADAVFTSPLTEPREVRRLAIVAFGSDDGLCGAYNVNISKKLVERVAQLRVANPEAEIEIYPIGAKMTKLCTKIQGVKLADTGDLNSKADGTKVRDFTKALVDRFLSGEVDCVETLYMKYLSVSRQRATAEQLLPVVQDTFAATNGNKESGRPYLFEPSAQDIFSSILPMFLLSVMQDVFTENRASEQAARVMAMQSANDNAKKLLEQLQLEYNKLRQQSITTELLDIVGGQIR